MGSITVRAALEQATRALNGQGLRGDIVPDVAHEFVSAELAGTKTHGLGKLISMDYGDRSAVPSYSGTGNLLLVNGNRQSGFVLFRELADKLGDLARANGVALALAHNYSRYSSLYPYCERAASKGEFVAVLANSAGPPAVAPFGGVDPITGTNPICFSFPVPDGIQSFDFATSALVWGEIRQAALEERPLRSDTFLDGAGEMTTEPSAVNAVRAFGGAKGWALNLALEILCGPLAGARAGLDVRDEYDCGAFFLVIDGSSQSDGQPLRASVGRLLDEVRSSRPSGTAETVRAPGDRRRGASFNDSEFDVRLEVPEATLKKMDAMAEGQSTADLASNPLFN
jgi:ureidoglycolate dehydrogenase (NAD+)/L-2-hydroxycarboxylate dehydrogenase (NAD+)